MDRVRLAHLREKTIRFLEEKVPDKMYRWLRCRRVTHQWHEEFKYPRTRSTELDKIACDRENPSHQLRANHISGQNIAKTLISFIVDVLVPLLDSDLKGAPEGRMEVMPLNAKSNNVKITRNVPELVKDDPKFAAAKKAEKEKDHAPSPPNIVHQSWSSGIPEERYQTGRLLGKGGFAICHEATLVGQKYGGIAHKFALKIVKAEMGQKKMLDKFRTELQIHSKMRHPNIVEFHRAFTFNRSTYIVLELCPNGSIMEMVKNRGFLSLPEIRRFGLQLLGAIKYMHARDVIHRDLKMGNLFLDKDMNIKIGDFGLAAIFVKTRRLTLCGTPNYIAPEILEKGRKGHDRKVDIWALGVIMFAMMTGKPPFQSATPEEIYARVKTVDYAWPQQINSKRSNDIPDQAKLLIASLLMADAADRPDPDEIATHPFFSMDGGIPGRISPECRLARPVWLLNKAPQGDVMDETRIELTSWDRLCQECGIAKYNVQGNDIKKSLFKECLEEEAAGRTPVVPLPSYKVYVSNPILTSWPLVQGSVSELPKHEVLPKDVTNLEGAQYDSAPLGPSQSESGNLVHRFASAPSHAATLRARANPSRGDNGLTRAQNGRNGTASIERENTLSVGTFNSNAQTLGDMDQKANRASSRTVSSGSSNHAPRLTRSATMSGTKRPDPRLNLSDEHEHGAPSSAPAQQMPISERVCDAVTKPGRARRARVARQVTEARIVSDVVNEMVEAGASKKETSRGPLPLLPRKGSDITNVQQVDEKISFFTQPQQSILISPDEVAEALPCTAPEAVLEGLRLLERNLSCALSTYRDGRCEPFDSASGVQSLKLRPAVVKWVDYTNRFGIGYVLANGSIGCVFNGKPECPSTCINVHHGEDHLRKRQIETYSEKHQIVPQNGTPIEFFENIKAEGLKRVYVKPASFVIDVLNGVPQKMTRVTDFHKNQKRQKLILWDKFARFMVGALGKSDDSSGSRIICQDAETYPDDDNELKRNTANPFVKFFQRLGNVSIWGFGNGAFQFNFPDHTKLMISDDGKWIDFYYLPSRAAERIKAGISLQSEDLAERRVLSYPTRTLLQGTNGSDDRFEDIILANELTEKVAFVDKVVNIWIRGQGLGSIDDSYLCRLKWEGMAEELHAEKSDKLVWCAVGAREKDFREELRRGKRIQDAYD